MKDIMPVTATFMLSDNKLNKWMKLRWELIRAYHAGECTTIYNCMRGVHYYKGVEYTL